jgi:hypothetical protein
MLGEPRKSNPPVGTLPNFEKTKCDKAGWSHAERDSAIGVILKSAQSACKSFRFVRTRVDRREQEKQANDRENETASQKAHNSQRGHDFLFVLLGLDPAFEISAQPAAANSGARYEETQANGADEPTAPRLSK